MNKVPFHPDPFNSPSGSGFLSWELTAWNFRKLNPNDTAAFCTDNTGLGFAKAINKHLLSTSDRSGIIQGSWSIALPNQVPGPRELTTI